VRNKGVVNQEQALTWDVENRLAAVTYTNRTTGGSANPPPATCNGVPCKRVFLPLVANQTPVERYSYDADGARVRKESKTEVTRTIGPHFEVTVAITNSQALTTTKYYDFGGQRIAVRQVVGPNQTLSYLHGDHLGSTSVTTSNSGAATNSVRYYAYGGQRSGNLFALPTDHTFTGQKLDRNTGLLYYGARYYDSGLGTFISPDSLIPDPGNPQDLNRYSYTRNNPLKYRDPSGHWVETAWDIANIAWDIAEVAAAPTPLNIGALVVDVAATVLPGVPGGAGLLARGSKAATKVVSHADDAVDAVRLAGHMGDGAHTVLTASRLRQVGAHSDEGVKLVKALAAQSTHGSGTRVVLGKWVEGGGYIAEAQKNGGIYYETASGVWDALGKNDALAWAVNEQFLRNQLENGIGRIDLVGESIDGVLKKSRRQLPVERDQLVA
jgi:RHS repeat-associated protein